MNRHRKLSLGKLSDKDRERLKMADKKDKNEAQDQGQAPDSEEKFEMSASQIQSIIQKAIAEDRASRPETVAPSAGRTRMRNADLVAQTGGIGRQTQEDVTTRALTVGPVTHEDGFLPAVPEFVATRDLDGQKPLIEKLEEMGYVVSLQGVEFRARWEPTEEKAVGDKIVRRVVNKPEPDEAKPLLDRLAAAEAYHSQIYLQGWVKSRLITGERRIDELAAESQHQDAIDSLRNQELANLESNALTPGGLAHLESTGAVSV